MSDVVAEFSKLYWVDAHPWTETYWLGKKVAKCPLDLWTYQEIIWETKPRLVIETGTAAGGSAWFFASVMEPWGGRVVTVDKDNYPHLWESHPRIDYRVGDSVSSEVAEWMRQQAYMAGRVMVSLDSLHTYEHVAREIELYSPLVSPGCYLVVEDTNVDDQWERPAARQAARELVARDSRFAADRRREKHLLTFNPEGWIRRTA